MDFTPLDNGIAVSPQLSLGDVQRAALKGFRAIISNRPDCEEAGQLTAEAIRAEAERHGLAFAHIPIEPGKASDAAADAMGRALDTLPGPVLAFCRSGARATTLWALGRADKQDPATLIRKASQVGHDIAALEPALRRRAADPS